MSAKLHDTAAAPTWHVVQTRANAAARASENLTRQGYHVFFPRYRKPQRAEKRMTTALRPLFPGYLFVAQGPGTTRWSPINSTYGVSRLVTDRDGTPRPVPTDAIAALQARTDAAGIVSPPCDFAIGDRVRVGAGPFADRVAHIESLPDDERVTLLFELMDQAIRVSVSRNNLLEY